MVMGLPDNWKASSCQARIDEGLQNSGRMRQLAGMKSRGWPQYLEDTSEAVRRWNTGQNEGHPRDPAKRQDPA